MMRILAYIHYLEIGGAERALIGMLNAMRRDDVQVDLLLNQHTGEFMQLIPAHVNVLPQMPEYSAIERPIRDIVKEGHIGIALRRLAGKHRHSRYAKAHPTPAGMVDESIFQYIFRSVVPGLRDLSHLGEYDLAISFLHPHNIVLDKVRARHKACWVHTDYSTIRIDSELELPVWAGYDTIAAISDDAAKAFAGVFPELAYKITVIENILSPASIREQAAIGDASAEMHHAGTKVLSIGRYCPAKRLERVPEICRRLADRGIDVHWYIMGVGDDAAIQAAIERHCVADRVTLLGKKSNPYPYIKACDIYAQPSLYEGKSVTVREAQILCKPAVISNYPTAPSQVLDGVDGVIAPLDIAAYADRLAEAIADRHLLKGITRHLQANDYGNEQEINKIYQLI